RQVGEHSAFAWTEQLNSEIVGIATLRVRVFCANSPCRSYVNGSLRGKSRLYRLERRPCQKKNDDDANRLFQSHVVLQAAWHSSDISPRLAVNSLQRRRNPQNPMVK